MTVKKAGLGQCSQQRNLPGDALDYSSLCATYPDALEVGIHVIDDGFGACVESQNMDAAAGKCSQTGLRQCPGLLCHVLVWCAVRGSSSLVAHMRRLTASPMPNSVPRTNVGRSNGD